MKLCLKAWDFLWILNSTKDQDVDFVVVLDTRAEPGSSRY